MIELIVKNVAIAEYLKAQRKARAASIKNIADILAVSSSTVWRAETKAGPMSVEFAVKLAIFGDLPALHFVSVKSSEILWAHLTT